MVVQALVTEHGISQRRACQASGSARSTLRYLPVAGDDSGVISFIQTYMALNPRHGFGLLYDSARQQGKPWGKTVLWRVYCELRLNLPRRGKKRLGQYTAASAHQAAAAAKRQASPTRAGVVTSCPTLCGPVGGSVPSTSLTSSTGRGCA